MDRHLVHVRIVDEPDDLRAEEHTVNLRVQVRLRSKAKVWRSFWKSVLKWGIPPIALGVVIALPPLGSGAVAPPQGQSELP